MNRANGQPSPKILGYYEPPLRMQGIRERTERSPAPLSNHPYARREYVTDEAGDRLYNRTTPTHVGNTLQKSQYSIVKVQNQPFSILNPNQRTRRDTTATT
jgi:hypothetical protein